MALPRITQKEMTEREQRELKTLLDRAHCAWPAADQRRDQQHQERVHR